MHTDEPLAPKSDPFEVEIPSEKLKRYKLPGTDQILAKIIQAGGNALCSDIQNLLILFGIRKNCHSSRRNLLFFLFKKMAMKLIVVITWEYHCYQLHIICYTVFSSQG
jgi:hypothetical protein